MIRFFLVVMVFSYIGIGFGKSWKFCFSVPFILLLMAGVALIKLNSGTLTGRLALAAMTFAVFGFLFAHEHIFLHGEGGCSLPTLGVFCFGLGLMFTHKLFSQPKKIPGSTRK